MNDLGSYLLNGGGDTDRGGGGSGNYNHPICHHSVVMKYAEPSGTGIAGAYAVRATGKVTSDAYHSCFVVGANPYPGTKGEGPR